MRSPCLAVAKLWHPAARLWLALAVVGAVAGPSRASSAAADVAPAAGSAGVAAVPAPVHVIDEKERVLLQQNDNVRLSLPTESDLEAWAAPGLRVELGYGYAQLRGAGPALSFSSKSVMLRPSVRIDRHWGLAVALLYGTGPGGLRWSATAEPTLYVWRQLSISAGVGYGGLDVSDPSAPTGNLQGPTVVVSRNLTAGERLQSCTGGALTSALRAEYLFVVGPLFASGPFIEGNAQWTRCEATFGGTDAETGRAIVLTQWWSQAGLQFGWWLAWR